MDGDEAAVGSSSIQLHLLTFSILTRFRFLPQVNVTVFQLDLEGRQTGKEAKSPGTQTETH